MSSAKPRDPGPAPRPVPPVTAEDENVKLAKETSMKSRSRRTGRRSTLMVPNSNAGYNRTFGA